MASPFLQDSSFWILGHRRRCPENIIARTAELTRSKQLAINDVVRLEILFGYKNRGEFQAVMEDLDGLPRLNLTRGVWDHAAELGFTLARAGARMPVPDLLIAATAIHYDAVLLHADSDFETIARHSALRTESYLDAA